MGKGPPIRVLSNQTVRAAVKGLANLIPEIKSSQNGARQHSLGEGEGSRAAKRQKRETYAVEVSYTEDTLPADLRKYYKHRHQLFSRYDEGIQMDREGWWSVTPEDVAAHVAERCRCDIIVDAFCGVGGNAIQFAFTCEHVIAIDNDATRLACAKHNAGIYGVEDRIEFICADFVQWARKAKQERIPIDVVYMSPPWGGIDYRNSYFVPGDRIADSPRGPATSFNLSQLKPLPGSELVALARSLSPDVAIFLPRNTNLHDVSLLAADESIEVEQQYIGEKFKGVTVYMGALVEFVS